MSIFKSLGTKLKRAISLKNLTNVVSGNFSAVGKDLIRVATTKSPAEIRMGQQSTEMVAPSFALPSEVNSFVAAKEVQYKDAVSSKLASSTAVQNASSILSQTYLKSMWLKYKNWFIGFLAFIVLLFVGIKIFKKSSPRRATRRR